MKTYVNCVCAMMLISLAAHAQSLRILPFEGRLTDSFGKAVPDGTKLIQFQIYPEPVSGIPLWAGEVHRTTINGGLVNVMLGSKNPFPTDRSDNPLRSFFYGILYLQVTVDSNGDGTITDADPPLLPRQAIPPVMFSSESGESRLSRDSLKLNGYDWSAILANGSTNPMSGKLDGSKLAANSVSADQIANGSILRDGLADGSVTIQKLAWLVVTNDAPVGGLAISTAAKSERIDKSDFVVVANLEVTINTIGRPVEVSLVPNSDVTDPDKESMIELVNGNTNSEATANIRIYRDNIHVQSIPLGIRDHVSNNSLIRYPPGSIRILDFPGPGKYTYQIQAKVKLGARMDLFNIRLLAREL